MAQRFSGYERRDREYYPTPEWVTRALLDHIGTGPRQIWEPACGNGEMALVMRERGHSVFMSDIEPGARVKALDALAFDFLARDRAPVWPEHITDIITNPPYGLGGRMALGFIIRSLELTRERGGLVAMLLKDNYDSARGRKAIFRDNPAWSMKLVLMRRIVWFESDSGHGPSENHAWYIWDWKHSGPARLFYAD